MGLQWAHIRALCSQLQPQGEFWINLLQNRDVSPGGVGVVRLLQHFPCLGSSAASVVLPCSFFWWRGLAVFPFPAVRSCFPSSAFTASPSRPFSACLGPAGGSEPRGKGSVPIPSAHWRSLSHSFADRGEAEHRDGGSPEP